MYCSQRDHHSGPAGHLAPAARPSPHSHHRSCQVVDARPSGSKICRHEGDRPAVPAQRRPCPPNTAGRLSGTRHYRSDYRRSTAPLPDGQALASRHSLRVGRSARRVRIWFSLRSPTLTATFHHTYFGIDCCPCKTRRQNWPAETGACFGVPVLRFPTQRQRRASRRPRIRRAFLQRLKITQKQRLAGDANG